MIICIKTGFFRYNLFFLNNLRQIVCGNFRTFPSVFNNIVQLIFRYDIIRLRYVKLWLIFARVVILQHIQVFIAYEEVVLSFNI